MKKLIMVLSMLLALCLCACNTPLPPNGSESSQTETGTSGGLVADNEDEVTIGNTVNVAYTRDIKYEGFYKNGEFHGKGFLHDKVNKIKYRGTFKEGMKQGNFEWSRPNDKGIIFTCYGKFVNDLPEGKHTFKFVDGEGYCFYKNGNKEGKEYYFYTDGQRRIRVFKDGKVIDDYYL